MWLAIDPCLLGLRGEINFKALDECDHDDLHFKNSMEDAGGQKTLSEGRVDKRCLRESPPNASTRTTRYEENSSEYRHTKKAGVLTESHPAS